MMRFGWSWWKSLSLVVFACIPVMFGVAACSSASQPGPDGVYVAGENGAPSEMHIKLKNGQTVTCLAASYGLSCSWPNTR